MNRPTRLLPHILAGVALFAVVPVCAALSETKLTPAIPLWSNPEDTAEVRPETATELFWEAFRLFNAGGGSDLARGREKLQKSAALDFSHARFELARCLLTGAYGFRLDAEAGAREFIRAAELGNGYAMVAAGQCYFEGTGVKPNIAKAEGLLRAALDENTDFSRPLPPDDGQDAFPQLAVAGVLWTDPVAANRAHASFLLGKIAEKRKKAAVAHDHFIAAAYAGIEGRDGNLDAAKQAAQNLALGTGTPRDIDKALELRAHCRVLSRRQAIAQVQGMVQAKALDEFATADAEEFLANSGDFILSLQDIQIARKLVDSPAKGTGARDAKRWLEAIADEGEVWAMIELAHLLGGKKLGTPDPETAFNWWERAAGDPPEKSTLAAANLAICLANGIGTPRDPARAAELFARYRDSEYLCHLGATGAPPKAPLSLAQGMALLEKAAQRKKNVDAQFLLGKRFLGNEDVPRDEAKAVELLTGAARAKHPGALVILGRISQAREEQSGTRYPDVPKSPVEYYMEASALGSSDGALLSGLAFHLGNGVRRDTARAEEYYRRCLDLHPGDASAHCNLGVIYEERLRTARAEGASGTEELLAKMMREYLASEQLGFTTAMVNLGKVHVSGEFMEADYDKAFDYFARAAGDGDPEAHFQLGLMHEKGQGVPVTYAEAAYHFRFAALARNNVAVQRLVDFYITGRGISRDLAMAEYWLRQTVDAGNWRALPLLAKLTFERADHSKAYEIYRRLSNMSDKTMAGWGYWGMSLCYAEGLGVRADKILSEGYLNLAVEYENPEALADLANSYLAREMTKEGVETMSRAAVASPEASYALGQMYFFGTNVEKDRAKSIGLMRDSARMHNPKAMFFLAAATFNREEEAPGLDEAILFASIAENMGLPEAPELREKLERRRDNAEQETEQIARPRSG